MVGVVVGGGSAFDFREKRATGVKIFAGGRTDGGAVIVLRDHLASRGDVHGGGTAGNFFHAQAVPIVSVRGAGIVDHTIFGVIDVGGRGTGRGSFGEQIAVGVETHIVLAVRERATARACKRKGVRRRWWLQVRRGVGLDRLVQSISISIVAPSQVPIGI